jgi:hypothetical protein
MPNSLDQLFLSSYRMVVRVSSRIRTNFDEKLTIYSALSQGLILNTQANPNATAGQAPSATSNNNFIDVSTAILVSLNDC